MNSLDYIVVVVYLVLLIGMGYCFKGQTSKDDYFLGGRTLSWQPLTLSVMATQLSAISFISAPAFVGLREGGGMIWLSYELGVPLAMILLLATIIPKLYRSGVISIYDYLEQRFSVSSRLLISLVFQLSRAFATGIMVYAVSVILQGTLGIEIWQSILLTGVITVLYSLQGGMKAVVYGDAIQLVLIILGTMIFAGFGLYYLGGFDAFVDKLDPTRLTAIKADSWGVSGDSFGLLPMIFGGVVLYASYYGCDQTQAQRSLAAKDEKNLKIMLLANGFARFPITLLYCFTGIVIGTLAFTTPEFMAQIPADNPDWMMPVFMLNYLPNGVIGLLVVAILAAAMSSLSSAINSLAAVTIEDYCRFTGKELTQSQYLSTAKYTSFFWGVITLTLSLYAGGIAPTIIEAINKVGSVFYGPILGVFLLAVVTKRVGAKAVNLALLSGVVGNLIVSVTLPDVFWFWWNFIGLSITLFVAFAVTHLIPNMKLPEPEKSEYQHILTWKDSFMMLAAFIAMLAICFTLPLLV
ncbi:sodium:solute symporter family transporter [Catenovulum sediminis]|uniref:Sodium/solute symporter n=1 Tax=Catenovulum sediminis TaxID=1740262 RepID=A0ABV1RCS1_9ALTE